MVFLKRKMILLHEIVDTFVLLGTLLGVTGTYWDIQHHILIGRDSFWIEPHLMVYAGVVLVFIGSLIGLFEAYSFKNKEISNRYFYAILAILISVIFQMGLAFFDNYWHQLFGLDVTVWSPPHLLLITAGCMISLSYIYFERLSMKLSSMKSNFKKTSILESEFMLAIVFIGFNIILAEFEFFQIIPMEHVSQLRNPLIYLIFLNILFSFLIAFGSRIISRKWIATKVVIFYLIIRFLTNTFLLENGASPIIPLFLIFPAIVFDLLSNIFSKNKFLIAAATSLTFVISSYVYFSFINIERYAGFSSLYYFLVICFGIISYYFGDVIGKKLMEHLNLY